MKKPLNAKGGGVVWDIGYGKSAVQYGNSLVEIACKAITAKSTANMKSTSDSRKCGGAT